MIPDFVANLLKMSRATPTWIPPVAPGSGHAIDPAVVAIEPATTSPAWKPNAGIPATATLPAFTAAGALEAANAARGQAVVDAVKDIGRVDTSRNPYGSGPWPLVTPQKK